MKYKYCIVFVIASETKSAHYSYRRKEANQAWRLGNNNFNTEEEAKDYCKKKNKEI